MKFPEWNCQDWLAGDTHFPAIARAHMHPSQPSSARMHRACRFSMHSDQIMHCMHAFTSHSWNALRHTLVRSLPRGGRAPAGSPPFSGF